MKSVSDCGSRHMWRERRFCRLRLCTHQWRKPSSLYAEKQGKVWDWLHVSSASVHIDWRSRMCSFEENWIAVTLLVHEILASKLVPSGPVFYSDILSFIYALFKFSEHTNGWLRGMLQTVGGMVLLWYPVIGFFAIPPICGGEMGKCPKSCWKCHSGSLALVYLVAWHPPLHTPYISSPNYCLLFTPRARCLLQAISNTISVTAS